MITRTLSIQETIQDKEIWQELLSYANFLTKDSDNAKDLLQETLLKALKYKASFTPWTNSKARLYTIMKNTFIDMCRKEKKYIKIEDWFFAAYTWHHTTYNEWESKIWCQDIEEYIANIEENLAKAFLLSYEWYKYKEIAYIFDIPIWTVKARIHRARQELQKALIQKNPHYKYRLKKNYRLR